MRDDLKYLTERVIRGFNTFGQCRYYTRDSYGDFHSINLCGLTPNDLRTIADDMEKKDG